MAGSISYNVFDNCDYIYRATSGGTSFSANLAGSAAFDYFDDSPTADDAIYFSSYTSNRTFAGLMLNVGTAMAGTDVVLAWEYYDWKNAAWTACHDITDNTSALTVTGSNEVNMPKQKQMGSITINGISSYSWVRLRLVSFTTVTEGGANATDRVTCGDGFVLISDYTDGSPCTFQIVYDWLAANAPETNPLQLGQNVFMFPDCNLNIASRLRSTQEIVFFGNFRNETTTLDMSYLHAGTKLGDDSYSHNDQSFFFFNAWMNTLGIASTSETKIYGGSLNAWWPIGATNRNEATYLGMSSGEWIGVNVFRTGYFTTANIINCIIKPGFIATRTPPAGLIGLDMKGNELTLLAYADGGVLKDTKRDAVTSSEVSFQTTRQNFIFWFIDQSRNCIDQPASGYPAFCYLSLGGNSNPTNVFFYDDSAGTYTDYTTAATNDTTGDVPISGDVGDILYIKQVSIWGTRMNIKSSLSSNDYEYIYEYYTAGAWKECPKVWDRTNNFTEAQDEFIAHTEGFATVTINSVSGYWFRIRIATKGTGTPAIDRIYVANSNVIGASEWNINEAYTMTFFVENSVGDPIVGAVITDVDGQGETYFLETIGCYTAETITSAETDIDVDDASMLSVGDYIYICFAYTSTYQTGEEIMKITNITGNTLTVDRGQLGTNAVQNTSYSGYEVFKYVQSAETDANGLTNALVFRRRKYYFDPINFSAYRDYVNFDDHSEHAITITKSGYITDPMPLTMDKKRVEVVKLENRREV